MGHRLCLGMVCLGLVLASCSTGDEVSSSTTDTDTPNPTVASTTVPAPDPPASSTTTTTDRPGTTTTTPASPAGFVPPQPFVAPAPAPSGGGSGCSPGPGPLPDGVWFGFIDDMTPDSIDFDLACFVSCEVGEGFAIRNDNPTSRTVNVQLDAVVVFANPDGDDWLDSFDAFQGYEEATLHNDVWIYINDGIVTHIANAAAVRGCRSSAVDVEWMAEHPMAIGVAFNDLGLIARRRRRERRQPVLLAHRRLDDVGPARRRHRLGWQRHRETPWRSGHRSTGGRDRHGRRRDLRRPGRGRTGPRHVGEPGADGWDLR